MIDLPTNENPVSVLEGDALASLRGMPDGCVRCCVTSPPYYGLRDYGHAGQIGFEPSPAEYVARLVDVFREVRRVLADDGTLWLNLGDSYVSSPPGCKGVSKSSKLNGVNGESGSYRARLEDGCGKQMDKSKIGGVKPKDLLGIPWRVAFALQADGWYLRQDIIWHKPNPMPESVRDRCTKAHEYVFLLSKSPRYYYDADAIAEPLARPEEADRKTPAVFGGRNKFAEAKKDSRLHSGNEYTGTDNGKRNRRSVWTVTPKPFKGAHFAVMPPELVRPCVRAGSTAGDVVLDPFGGSGTTGLVALEEGRRAVLCELNPGYANMARERVAKVLDRGLFALAR